ncbi:MAG: hypothetical protein AABW54_04735 [Candidatus Micrarchaeota archaeon]
MHKHSGLESHEAGAKVEAGVKGFEDGVAALAGAEAEAGKVVADAGVKAEKVLADARLEAVKVVESHRQRAAARKAELLRKAEAGAQVECSKIIAQAEREADALEKGCRGKVAGVSQKLLPLLF